MIVVQELIWGPAKAITPSANATKGTSSASASNSASQAAQDAAAAENAAKAAKAKKKKSKRVDSSLLGFTVQADPDRINVGEIEHLDS